MYIMLLIRSAPITAIILMAAFGVLGAISGSHITRIAHHKASGSGPTRGRSRCPHCGHALSASDTIPLISWLMLHGKCRYCGQRISIRYVAAELILALSFMIVIWCYGVTVQGIALCILTCVLLGVSLTDLEARIIPNVFIGAGVLTWLLAYVLALFSCTGVLPQIYTDFCTLGCIHGSTIDPFFGEDAKLLGGLFLDTTGDNPALAVLLDALTGAIGVSAFMYIVATLLNRVTGSESLGMGDIKLFFLTGLFLGLTANIFDLVLSCVLGIVFGLVLNHGRGTAFPFGPAIAVATCICMIFAPFILGA